MKSMEEQVGSSPEAPYGVSHASREYGALLTCLGEGGSGRKRGEGGLGVALTPAAPSSPGTGLQTTFSGPTTCGSRSSEGGAQPRVSASLPVTPMSPRWENRGWPGRKRPEQVVSKAVGFTGDKKPKPMDGRPVGHLGTGKALQSAAHPPANNMAGTDM